MLNYPIVYEQKIQTESPKISLLEEVEYRQFTEKKYWSNQNINVVIEKDKSNKKFEIIITNNFVNENQILISINNKINFLTPESWNRRKKIIITSSELGGIEFKDISTIAIGLKIRIFNSNIFTGFRDWVKISELNIKFKRNDLANKIFFIDDKSLEVETNSSFIISQYKYQINLFTKKTIISISPEKMVVGRHNTKILEIKNNSNNNSPIISPKFISGLEMFNKNHKSKIIYKKNEFKNNDVLGAIYFNENTYYDFNKENTYNGIGIGAKTGYIIPYKFKGTFTPLVTLDIDFIEDISIGFAVDISQPYFNKYFGKIKLKIKNINKDYEDNFKDQYTIDKLYFADIISQKLSLNEIKNLWTNEK